MSMTSKVLVFINLVYIIRVMWRYVLTLKICVNTFQKSKNVCALSEKGHKKVIFYKRMNNIIKLRSKKTLNYEN